MKYACVLHLATMFTDISLCVLSLQNALQTVSPVWTVRHVHGAGQACTSSVGGATMSVQRTMSPMTNSWSAQLKVSPLSVSPRLERHLLKHIPPARPNSSLQLSRIKPYNYCKSRKQCRWNHNLQEIEVKHRNQSPQRAAFILSTESHYWERNYCK